MICRFRCELCAMQFERKFLRPHKKCELQFKCRYLHNNKSIVSIGYAFLRRICRLLGQFKGLLWISQDAIYEKNCVPTHKNRFTDLHFSFCYKLCKNIEGSKEIFRLNHKDPPEENVFKGGNIFRKGAISIILKIQVLMLRANYLTVFLFAALDNL